VQHPEPLKPWKSRFSGESVPYRNNKKECCSDERSSPGRVYKDPNPYRQQKYPDICFRSGPIPECAVQRTCTPETVLLRGRFAAAEVASYRKWYPETAFPEPLSMLLFDRQ
jgi:hypothetical protein